MIGTSAIHPRRVGIIGFGNIGRDLVERIRLDSALELAFLHSRSPVLPDGISPAEWCSDLSEAAHFAPDIIVEVAHPQYTTEWGARFLQHSDYLPVSTSALIDDRLRIELTKVANDFETRLLLPHGALVGLNSLIEVRDVWREVSITFIKHPSNLEANGDRPEGLAAGPGTESVGATVLHDGTVRDLAVRYPRNVNSMITLALATVGLDHCRGRLVADPAATTGRLEIQARGHDGSELSIVRSQPMLGVSGSEMLASVWGSVVTSAGVNASGIQFV